MSKARMSHVAEITGRGFVRRRIGHTARCSTLPAMRVFWFMTADAGTNGMSSTGKLASV
jgi:hypothetical protein